MNLTRSVIVERYPVTEKDKELIEIGLLVLANNFDDGVYNHTVGCAILCRNGNICKGVNCDGIHGLTEWIAGLRIRALVNMEDTNEGKKTY